MPKSKAETFPLLLLRLPHHRLHYLVQLSLLRTAAVLLVRDLK